MRHLIVISNDAMVGEDLALAARFPAFRRFLDWNCRVERVKTIYPSLTHPVHASLLTGCAAGKTGIISNERFVPGQIHTDWFNALDEICCDTIFHAAKRAGLTTCACRWPVTAGGREIDYLLPEVIGDGDKGDLAAFYEGICSPGMLPIALLHAAEGEQLPRHPNYDRMSVRCLCDVIRQKKPHLAMTHLGLPDAARHQWGLFSAHLEDAYRDTDEMLGWIFDAVRDAGIEEETDYLLLSDHGQLNITRSIALNAVLAEEGWITVDGDGRVRDWRMWAHTTSLSAQVYLSRPEDAGMRNEAMRLLVKMRDDGLYGFSEILTREEAAARYGLTGGFSFVLETDGYTSFSEDWRRPFVREIAPEDYKTGRATHGHMPEKGPQPPLLAMGRSFRRNSVAPDCSILDEAPTMARVLGLDLPEAQGAPIMSLLV